MKKKIIMLITIIILILIGLLLVLVFTNRTFFNNYYEATNLENERIEIPIPKFSYYEKSDDKINVTFRTLRSVENGQYVINKYLDKLQTCYDESYFYDSDSDITINAYYVEKAFPFNKIYLKYNYGNYCENEYVLEDNWVNDFIDSAQVSEVVIKECKVENDNINCNSKNIINKEIKEIIDSKLLNDNNRIENKKNITFNEKADYYSISVYYIMENSNYVLSIFKYDKYLAFRVTDANDHSKNAIYNVKKDINQLFNNIYRRY